MTNKYFFCFVFIAGCSFSLISCEQDSISIQASKHDLVFEKFATDWDEAIPLGNGMLGVLVWKKDSALRFSLDRADLWDLRPMENRNKPEFSFKWIKEQVKNKTYKNVQDMFDAPYETSAGPTKIPGAALEFKIGSLGKVKEVRLMIENALCRVEWENGATLLTFVRADAPEGWFIFENIKDNLYPVLIPPQYETENTGTFDNSVTGQDLVRLGYKQGSVKKEGNKIVYRQQGWNDFEYEVAVAWDNSRENKISGAWSITSTFSENMETAGQLVNNALESTFNEAFDSHRSWWEDFWSKSAIQLPDSVLEKQWYLEQYKFGSAARPDTPPISLQAVWTADNGKLPPWKGDFHHDLNTQLSYWPAYSANHLDLEEGFLNWLWDYRENFKTYTRDFFQTSGLNVPGVTTLTGEPMGGWSQYSFGLTISSWLAQHFYLHWIYSQDTSFLRNRAYPWIKATAIYLEEISIKEKNGMRKLPLSSSPEINNNSIDAWFSQSTNFDLAFVRWTYIKATEMAKVLGLEEEAGNWEKIFKEWPGFALDDIGGLAFAPDFPYKESHRHFSHLVAWHPLALIDWSGGEQDSSVIRATISTLEKSGRDWWCGYSYSWMGNLYARAMMGNKAAETLKIFAENFCLPNSFHVNGEQHDRGYSKFKYRPFTLEGNFAFAAAVQEMLIQSHAGFIRIFPAIPSDWEAVSFSNFRTEGAFLVSAVKKSNQSLDVTVKSEKGGNLRIANPFPGKPYRANGNLMEEEVLFETMMTTGEEIHLQFSGLVN